MSLTKPSKGVVVAFEEERGLGTLRGEDGSEVPFHCVAVADGSRRVEVGRSVVYLVGPGHRGVLEATVVVAL